MKQIDHHKIEIAATDGNYTYDKVIPFYIKHVINKAETCLVEAENSNLRDMLARLNRRSKRYSKCPIMLRQAIAMWHYKDIALSIYI
jgi:IS1 family transposase